MNDAEEPDLKQVRTRDRRSIEAFTKFTGLPDESILEWVGTDYAYRVLALGVEWEHFVADRMEKSQATNFKTEVGRSAADKKMVDALHSIWWIMYQYQEEEPKK